MDRRPLPPPGPPNVVCRTPGPCCEESDHPRSCNVLSWIGFTLFVALMLGLLALVIIDMGTVGHGLD